MRFLLFDRILDLEKGRRILGLTAFGRSSSITLCGGPSATVPTSMLIEAMVQILGWSIIHDHDFHLAAIVCLIENATIHGPPLVAGVSAEVGGEILSNGRDDSLGRAWLDIDGDRRASIDRVIYRHFHDVDPKALEHEFRMRAGLAAERIGLAARRPGTSPGLQED